MSCGSETPARRRSTRRAARRTLRPFPANAHPVTTHDLPTVSPLTFVRPAAFTRWEEGRGRGDESYDTQGGTDERHRDSAAGDGRGICGSAYDARWVDAGAGPPYPARRVGRAGLGDPL